MSPKRETIVAAAMLSAPGQVFTGVTHACCRQAAYVAGHSSTGRQKAGDVFKRHRELVSRAEALAIAERADQQTITTENGECFPLDPAERGKTIRTTRPDQDGRLVVCQPYLVSS